MSNIFLFNVEYSNKKEMIQMDIDSEFFQLKMIICGKLKIYDISKIYIYHNEKLLNGIDDKTTLNSMFECADQEIKLKLLDQKIESFELNLTNFNNSLLLPPPKELNILYICLCNNKNEAVNVCIKCFKIICDDCKKRDPHLLHRDEVIKRNNFNIYMQDYIKSLKFKLDEEIFSDEAYVFLQNFQETIKSDVDKINKTYEYLKKLLEEIKNIQINYLLSLEEKLNFCEKNLDLNDSINNFMDEIKEVVTEMDIEKLMTNRKKIGIDNESIKSKYALLTKNLNFYLTTCTDFQIFNKKIKSTIKDDFSISLTTFNTSNMNSKIANLFKNDYIKHRKLKKDQIIMRVKDNKTILFYNASRPKTLKTKSIYDNCNFKNNYQAYDQLELNIDNKLFIIAGKKYKQFYCYDFERNEINQLADLKYSHFYGNLIYVPLNNCIYCIGGNKTKKCEIYRNDDIVYSNLAQDIKFNKSSWESIAEMNFYRQEFSSILFKNFIYVFFGLNNFSNLNENNVERLDVLNNNLWEPINFFNPCEINLCLNSHATLILNEKEILIIGGFDGQNYLDTSVVFNVNYKVFREFQMKIPNLKKNNFYQFYKESRFINVIDHENILDKSNYALFDSKDRIHILNSNNFCYDIIGS